MNSSSAAPDVAVVGAGIIGCATAYFLASEHHLRCVVIERDAVGSQASGNAAGELSPVGRSLLATPFIRLAVEGLRLHRALAPTLVEESGIEYHLTAIPILRPAFTEEEEAELRQQIGWQRELGIESSWVDTQALSSMGSWLPPEILGAAYSEESQLESYPFALALAQAAERHGVVLRAGEVTGLLRSGTRATGVLVGQEAIAAGAVVIANGPWSKFAGEWLGYEVPVKPLKGQIVHLTPPAPLHKHAIFHASGYVLPKPSGQLIVGTTEEDAGFQREPTLEGQDRIMETIVRLAPILLNAPIKNVTACLRPLSLDGLPFIGRAPGWDDVYLATGHGSKGIVQCLATGKYLAQLIARGHSDYPLDPFSPQRLVATGKASS